MTTSLRTALVLPLALLGLALAPAAARAQELRIHHLDVEQGDATVIISPDGHALLFDAGNDGKGRDRVVPRLLELGVSRLDYTVLSHYDADHVGGLDEVLVNGFAPTIAAYDRGNGTTRVTQVVQDYFNAAGPLRRAIQPGDVLNLGAEVSIECVAVNGVTSEGTSAGTSADEENENSVSLVLHYRDFDYFVAGDLTAGGLATRDVESLVAPIVRSVDVLRVSHHGSPTSTGQPLLDRLVPEVAIISDGCMNVYNHPDQGVVDRLTASPGLQAIWVTNKGNLTTTSPKMIVVGQSSGVDGEIALRTDGLTTFSVNGVAYPIVADHRAPAIVAGPTAGSITGDRATITWSTDELAEAYVEYGFSPTSFGSSAARRTLARDHAILLQNLAPQATYYYRVASIDAAGNGPTWSATKSFTTAIAAGGVVINEVASYGSDVDEWVELFNAGAADVELTGWALTDNDAHVFTFPTFVLPAHGYVVVTSGTLPDAPDTTTGRAVFNAGGAGRFGSTAVWNNDGDDVELRNARSVTVDFMIYGTGTGIDPAPAGHFTNDVASPTRPLLGQSVARYPNGTDHNTASDWARPAAPTKWASNGGEPPPPPSPPVAEAGLPAYGFEGSAVTFDASASRAIAPAAIATYTWTFGDGTTASGAVVSHVFGEDGSWDVVLTVTDTNGLSATDSTTAEIANVAPTASAGGPYDGFVGTAIVLRGSATDPSPQDAAVLRYTWDFGDGSPTDFGATVSHYYWTGGTYTVTLTVDDGDGGRTTSAAQVVIHQWTTSPLALASVRDNATGAVYLPGSAVVTELAAPGESLQVDVSGGLTKWMEARFAPPAAPLTAVSSAAATVSYRMLSSRWAGTLRLELWADGVLLGSTTLAKATSLTTVRWDITGLVTPTNAGNLAVRMVNDVPGTARVVWSYAALELTAY